MQGTFVRGIGNAHKMDEVYSDVFNCRMYGTFNIYIKTIKSVENFKPVMEVSHKRFPKRKHWLVKVKKGDDYRYGWAVRWADSKQNPRILELLSKRKFPESFKEGKLEVTVLKRWTEAQIKSWTKQQHWFQTYDWLPNTHADSQKSWDEINIIDWSGKSVLDIGCHQGYHSMKMSQAGAYVIGFEPNDCSRGNAIIVNDSIEMSDVHFRKIDHGETYDVITYLSVHHQPDPSYKNLKVTIDKLKSRARETLFVELILPPMFGNTMTEEEIDKLVDGKALLTYKHNVRGTRKIYQCKGISCV